MVTIVIYDITSLLFVLRGYYSPYTGIYIEAYLREIVQHVTNVFGFMKN